MVKNAALAFTTLAMSFLVAAGLVFGQSPSPTPTATPTASPSPSPTVAGAAIVPSGAPSTGAGN